MNKTGFIRLNEGFFARQDYTPQIRQLGLCSLEDVFSFTGGKNLYKKELTAWRSRTEISLPDGTRWFLKRYTRPPVFVQIKNWFAHRSRQLTACCDFLPAERLQNAGIQTPTVLAFGGKWNGLFEEKSFVLTLEIPQGQSLETKLPDCFYNGGTENRRGKLAFINRLADFARTFHDTGFCHRDFYLCHIFLSRRGDLYLIDLQRTFRPFFFKKRWKLKDITQLYYSASGNLVSRTDRLRFYLRYLVKEKLSAGDRFDIKRIKARVWRMADRDIRRGKSVPFAK